MRQRWLGTALLAGAIYFAVGFTSGALAGAAASERMQFAWRLSAFIISGLLFGIHVAYEHARLRNTARATAWHTSVAVAIGAFLLALAANIHDVMSATGYRPRMVVALVIWPIGTAVPAFIVALAVAAGLRRVRPTRPAG